MASLTKILPSRVIASIGANPELVIFAKEVAGNRIIKIIVDVEPILVASIIINPYNTRGSKTNKIISATNQDQ